MAIWAVVLVATVFAIKYLFFNKKDKILQVQTTAITEQTLYKEVLATGTINLIEVVEVGTQVSGTISAVLTDFNMITTAVKEVLITTPYFIPNEAMLKSILVTAKSGVEVKILLPKVSDGHMVQMACLSYVEELLQNKVRVFFIQKRNDPFKIYGGRWQHEYIGYGES